MIATEHPYKITTSLKLLITQMCLVLLNQTNFSLVYLIVYADGVEILLWFSGVYIGGVEILLWFSVVHIDGVEIL